MFLALQAVSYGVAAVAFTQHDSPRHAVYAVHGLLAVSLCLLAASFLRLALRPAFAGVAVGILCFLPALGQMLALMQGAAAFEKMSIELTFLLTVPLVLAAWKYSFRIVVGLTLATGMLDACILAASPLQREQLELMAHLLADRTLALLIIGYVVSRLAREQRDQNASLERANTELGRYAMSLEHLGASRERNRVARELHDTLAHTLSAIALQLEAASTERTWDASKAEDRVRQAREMARSGLVDVRRALRELRACPIDDLGLVLALGTLGEQVAERTGASLSVALPERPVDLPKEVEQGLYRIVQEALSNVERHAGAKQVRLELRIDAGAIELSVEDDGSGFERSELPGGTYGLLGLEERAALLGGTLSIRSAPGAGTSIRLVVAAGVIQDRVGAPP
jgi:signal transduction histidine kinase